MKLKSLIKDCIKINIQEGVTKSCLDDFGNYLFGEFDAWHKEYEKNTPVERQTWTSLVNFILGDQVMRDKNKLIDSFKQLHKCMSSYPDILKPDTNNLYRSTKIKYDKIFRSEKDARHYLENTEKYNKFITTDREFSRAKYVLIRSDFKYEPRSEIQSWSTNEKYMDVYHSAIAMGYAKVVVYKTIPKSDLLFSSKFLNSVAKNEIRIGEENEIIRIGKSLSGCDLYISTDEYTRKRIAKAYNIRLADET